MRAIALEHTDVPTVCIGGINAANVQRVLYQSSDSQKKLDGVAVVSAIIAATDPKRAAQELKHLIGSPPPFASATVGQSIETYDVARILQKSASIIQAVGEKSPLSHNMTNLVVQNFAANVALAVVREVRSALRKLLGLTISGSIPYHGQLRARG